MSQFVSFDNRDVPYLRITNSLFYNFRDIKSKTLMATAIKVWVKKNSKGTFLTQPGYFPVAGPITAIISSMPCTGKLPHFACSRITSSSVAS